MPTKARLVDLFADIEIDDTEFEQVWKDLGDQELYEQRLKNNPNSIVLYQTYRNAKLHDRDQDCREYRALINMFKLLLIEFGRSPYWNSRIGWWMWFWVCYARYDSYYPMKWCFHYDPLNQYMHDEPMRPDGLECPARDDPFNIKGECFVHPEWYKQRAEDAERQAQIDQLVEDASGDHPV